MFGSDDRDLSNTPIEIYGLHLNLRFKVQGFFICHIINYTGYNQK